jgi:hypothetical protein
MSLQVHQDVVALDLTSYVFTGRMAGSATARPLAMSNLAP